jgi:hypothetical protein
MNLTTIIVLLLLFQVKHFLADYPLQTKYMLGKFKEDGWFLPLVSHAAVHGAFTFVIALHFVKVSDAFVLGLLDLCVHYFMDRMKASPNVLGRFKPFSGEVNEENATPTQRRDNKLFWWSLGFDQMVHHLTHYGIIILILLKSK